MGLTWPELIGGEGATRGTVVTPCRRYLVLPVPLSSSPRAQLSAHSFRRCRCVGRWTSLALWLWCQRCRGALSPSSLPSAGVQEAEVPVWRDGTEPALRRAQDHPGKGDRGTEGLAGGREATRTGRCAADALASSPLWNGPGRGTETAQLSFSLKPRVPTANANVLRECSDGKHKDRTSAPGNRLRGEPSEDGADCRSPGSWPMASGPARGGPSPRQPLTAASARKTASACWEPGSPAGAGMGRQPPCSPEAAQG